MHIKKSIKTLKFIRIIAILSCILYFVLPFAYGHAIDFFNSNNVFAKPNKKSSKELQQAKPISFLLLGVDQGIEGRHDQGNSDTIILATVNPKQKKTTLLSIPRDSLTRIQSSKVNPNYKYFKINSAYEVGGVNCSQKTVAKMLNIPIDYYALVNMKSLKEIVNAIGGVDVKVPFSFKYDWCDFHKGYQHLNGRHAVSYVRMRHQDPRGDYGRQTRQRQVIEAVIHQALKNGSIAKYHKLVSIFNKYAKTNLSFSDMLELVNQYQPALKQIQSVHLQGHDATIDSSDIQVISTKELQNKSNLLRKTLNLRKETLNNEETRLNRLNHVNWKNPNKFDNYSVKQ